MKRLTPAEQHKLNADIILNGRKLKNLAPPSKVIDKLYPEEKENRHEDLLETQKRKDDLMSLKKSDLQMICTDNNIPFENNFNKSQLSDMILKGTTDV